MIYPQEPHYNPNPEQTASILSMMLYNFLDPVVFSAYRISHLSFEQLPPLADYDYTKNLVRRSFPVSVNQTTRIIHLWILKHSSIWIYPLKLGGATCSGDL